MAEMRPKMLERSKSTGVRTSCWIPFVFTPHTNPVSSLNSADPATQHQNLRLQSISCRDWWLARLLILCNIKRHAIDYLSTGIKVVLEGLKPTEATLIISNYNVYLVRFREVAMICPVLILGASLPFWSQICQTLLLACPPTVCP